MRDGNGKSLFGSREQPLVMGVLNLTPDSFYAGSRIAGDADLVSRARMMVAAGAAILDLGGESSRPGAAAVAEDEELARVVPAVEALASLSLPVAISVDTRRPAVARAALAAGATIVNDIGGLGDPAMRRVVADGGAAAVVMHMRGTPGTMQDDPQYGDVLGEVGAFFAARIALALADGIPRERLALDPGIGFGKRQQDNLALLAGLGVFLEHGLPLLVGVSRKSLVGHVTGRPVEERLLGTCLLGFAALERGASVLRVHDVAEAVETVKIFRALDTAGG